MRVYVQWAKDVPEDWESADITRNQEIRRLPKKPPPTGSETLDGDPGWVVGANCQGILFSGYDHLAVEVVGDGLRFTGWQDDPVDWGDSRFAVEWTLMPPAFDPLVGEINTVQTRRVWATPDVQFLTGALPWEEFVLPPANQTFHGIWVPPGLWDAHRQARSPHRWREWIT